MLHPLFPVLRNALFSALLLFSGYALADPGLIAAEQVTGTWISSEQIPEQGQVDTLMTIKADGSFSGSLLVNNETVWTFSGNWTLDGNAINWEYTESSLVLLVEDRSEVDTVLSLGQDEMELKSGRRDSVRTLRRVQ
jgi:beta-glucanase (GH16 family)